MFKLCLRSLRDIALRNLWQYRYSSFFEGYLTITIDRGWIQSCKIVQYRFVRLISNSVEQCLAETGCFPPFPLNNFRISLLSFLIWVSHFLLLIPSLGVEILSLSFVIYFPSRIAWHLPLFIALPSAEKSPHSRISPDPFGCCLRSWLISNR